MAEYIYIWTLAGSHLDLKFSFPLLVSASPPFLFFVSVFSSPSIFPSISSSDQSESTGG